MRKPRLQPQPQPNMAIVNAYLALWRCHLNAANRPLQYEKTLLMMAGYLWDLANHAERLLIIEGTA